MLVSPSRSAGDTGTEMLLALELSAGHPSSHPSLLGSWPWEAKCDLSVATTAGVSNRHLASNANGGEFSRKIEPWLLGE